MASGWGNHFDSPLKNENNVGRSDRFSETYSAPLTESNIGVELVMTTIKVIEVMSESTESWEAAAQSGVSDVCESVNGVNSVWVKDQSAVVENGRITKYRVKLKISFTVER